MPEESTFVEFDGIRFGGATPVEGFVVLPKGIESWRDLPAVKSKTEARVVGDGDFPLRDVDVAYSARTVTFHCAAITTSRAEFVAAATRVNGLNHRIIPVRVCDVDDTFVEGYIETAFPSEWTSDWTEFVVTVSAQAAGRQSWGQQLVTLTGSASSGALTYPIAYPIQYDGSFGASSAGDVTNVGNDVAYPVITVHGNLSGGFTLSDNRGRALVYAMDVLLSAPVTIDCERRVASVGGVNVSWALAKREWFTVPPGQSARINFSPAQAAGPAWADVTLRSRWI